MDLEGKAKKHGLRYTIQSHQKKHFWVKVKFEDDDTFYWSHLHAASEALKFDFATSQPTFCGGRRDRSWACTEFHVWISRLHYMRLKPNSEMFRSEPGAARCGTAVHLRPEGPHTDRGGVAPGGSPGRALQSAARALPAARAREKRARAGGKSVPSQRSNSRLPIYFTAGQNQLTRPYRIVAEGNQEIERMRAGLPLLAQLAAVVLCYCGVQPARGHALLASNEPPPARIYLRHAAAAGPAAPDYLGGGELGRGDGAQAGGGGGSHRWAGPCLGPVSSASAGSSASRLKTDDSNYLHHFNDPSKLTGIPSLDANRHQQQLVAEAELFLERMRDAAKKTLKAAVGLHESGDLRGAEKLYRQVMRVAPLHPDLHNNLALLLANIERNTEASDAWHEGWRLRPGDTLLRSNYAIVHHGRVFDQGTVDAEMKSRRYGTARFGLREATKKPHG
eukprot:SAG22_NODE_1665_length_3861_cov_4.460128_2_plen_448_part_00